MAYPTGPQHASIDPDPDRPPAVPEAIAFVASGAKSAQEAKVELVDRYGNVPPDEAEVIVALGGDGFMLESMHRYMALQTPIFGMNRGTIGFLMNTYEAEELPHRLARGQHQTLRPLRMTANSEGGNRLDAVAFNEVSMLRQERQAAKLRLFINDRERMEELICDGIIVSTAAGSTAYNLLQNNGAEAHQAVDDVHIHIIPKYADGSGLELIWNAGTCADGEAMAQARANAVVG
ncbi:MAG: NAD kinase [Actinomycetota bacterium]